MHRVVLACVIDNVQSNDVAVRHRDRLDAWRRLSVDHVHELHPTISDARLFAQDDRNGEIWSGRYGRVGRRLAVVEWVKKRCRARVNGGELALTNRHRWQPRLLCGEENVLDR